MDRDGETDLMFSGAPSTRWANLERQIVTNDPVVGGTLNVDLCAKPQHIVSYLIGFGRRDLFIPGIGWSALDPSAGLRAMNFWPFTIQ